MDYPISPLKGALLECLKLSYISLQGGPAVDHNGITLVSPRRVFLRQLLATVQLSVWPLKNWVADKELTCSYHTMGILK